jgi:hypothetical protein
MVCDVAVLDNQLVAQDIRDKRTFFNIESGDALFHMPVNVFADVNRIDGHYLVQDSTDRTQFFDLRTGAAFRSPGIELSSQVNHVADMYLVVALDHRTVVDIKTSRVQYNAPDDIMGYQVSDVFGYHVATWGLNAARLFDLRSHALLAEAPTWMFEIQTIKGRFLALSSLGKQFFEIVKA